MLLPTSLSSFFNKGASVLLQDSVRVVGRLCTKNRYFSCSSRTEMRFVQYTCVKDGPQRLGAQLSDGGDIIEISAVKPELPNNLVDFLKGGPELMNKAKR